MSWLAARALLLSLEVKALPKTAWSASSACTALSTCSVTWPVKVAAVTVLATVTLLQKVALPFSSINTLDLSTRLALPAKVVLPA